MNTLEEAAAWLAEHGLVARVVEGKVTSIIGGTGYTESPEFSLYHNTFQIEPAPDGWEVIVAGPGQLNTTIRSKTLADAVTAVRRILSKRRSD